MVEQTWRKSSYSGGGHQDCVECRADGPVVQVRDTRHRQLGHLAFPAVEWTALLAGAQLTTS
ncbi:DUF397 domain-containing protein [Nocardiopsis dassonvillei]|uniref:DUF397 domain-containing protein n=1 Tax=Nocardiopsis dassonvillei TaxID=2014 RepID=UPI0033E49E36